MGLTAPCKDCPNRKVGCHGTCEKYIKFSEEQAALREKLRKEREAIHILNWRK